MKDLSKPWADLVDWLQERVSHLKEEAPDAGTVKEYAQILKTLKDSKPSKDAPVVTEDGAKSLDELLKEKGLS